MASQKETLEAILFIAAKDKMSILEVEALAKTLGKPITFDLVGPKSRFRCKFLDAHYGLFTRIGGDEAFHVKNFQFVVDVWCENVGDFT